MRKRDLHILTIDTTVYTNDDRFESVHPNQTSNPTERARFGDQSPDWVLKIHTAKVEDSGVYECQINTEPKRSKKYQLLVIGEPAACCFLTLFFISTV